jgi:hypothetical protein
MPWALVIAVLTVAAAWRLAPAVVNGDGLGYLKASLDTTIYPGHLGYLPLLRLLRSLSHAGPRAIDGLLAARALSAASGGIAVLALAASARRMFPLSKWAPPIAALGLAVSYGLFAAASDVETYAPALAALCLAFYALTHRAVVLGGLMTVAATLLHVESVLFVLPAIMPLHGRPRWTFLLVVALGLGAAYGAAVHHFGMPWLLGATHGFHYPLRWSTPAIAVYGACKSLIYSPYPYEAPWPRVLIAFGLGALALLILLIDVGRKGALPLGRAVTFSWLIPYSLVGALFFASDSERWVFLLPLFWLSVAARGARLALITILGIAAANAMLWLPIARDPSFRDRAAAAAPHLHPGDLVISPGHGWDEYLGIYDGPTVEHYPLVFHAARLHDRTALRSDLAAAITRTRAAGHTIFLARLSTDDSPLGWKELAPLGITRENASDLLPPGQRTPLGPLERWDGDGVK